MADHPDRDTVTDLIGTAERLHGEGADRINAVCTLRALAAAAERARWNLQNLGQTAGDAQPPDPRRQPNRSQRAAAPS